jgi:asparagine synthase (glutamine-hydrolysing)
MTVHQIDPLQDSPCAEFLQGHPQASIFHPPGWLETLQRTYKSKLAEDLLLEADKMTMANSVELRVPLLDHELLEFAASLPGNYKVRGFTTKYIAKRVLGQRVPHGILERKKIGFPVPYETFATDLRDWVRDVLLDGKTLGRSYFKKECIELLLSGNRQRGSHSK